MADDDIRRLQRSAERSGPTPFLHGLCDPDAGDLLRRVDATGRARVRSMVDYVDRTEGARRLAIVRVQDHEGEGLTPFLLLRDLGSGQLHELSLDGTGPTTPVERRAHEAFDGFVNLLRVQGAEPRRCQTWVGKEVLVLRRGCWAPTFAAHVAWVELEAQAGRRPRPPHVSLEPVELEELLEAIDQRSEEHEPWAEPGDLECGEASDVG